VDANYPRHVRVAWVHPANVRAAGRMIADRVVCFKEKGIVSPRVCAEFRIVVQRTQGEGCAAALLSRSMGEWKQAELPGETQLTAA